MWSASCLSLHCCPLCPMSQLQLSDLLKEKRQEVEREHAKQMEKLMEAHQEALARTQGEFEKEVRLQASPCRGSWARSAG